ncbi:hypothetical protein OWV82_014967 [Melia azedarach]|uniref:Uncharacterized protein n=1 Tax=Melia azedarach TaxID=155640 RepID=A0ACC1XN91_MELAZ|nr:hypothetical protein OWV82_014967 [Melia azedarach]
MSRLRTSKTLILREVQRQAAASIVIKLLMRVQHWDGFGSPSVSKTPNTSAQTPNLRASSGQFSSVADDEGIEVRTAKKRRLRESIRAEDLEAISLLQAQPKT